MKTELDLAIIGGGIIGVCAAWYARKQFPGWQIGIFDQSQVGRGATFYSASLDLPYGQTPMRYRLAKRSRELFYQLRKEVPGLPIKDLPFYGIVSEENANKVLEQLADANAKLTPEIIPSLLNDHPHLLLPQQTTVISGAAASRAIKNEVANLLAKAFESTPGSFIIEYTRILKVTSRERILDLQTTDGKVFHSKRVIQATGPWINEFSAAGLAADKNIRIRKMVAFHIYEQPKPTDPVFCFFDDEAFLMPNHEEGYWLFSFKSDHWDVTPDITTLNINDDDVQKARAILRKYYPSFAPLCASGRVFCDAYAQDGDPVIELAGDNPGYIIAGAGAGSGYRLAPAIAEEALRHFVV